MAAVLIAAAHYYNLQQLLRDALEWIENAGPAGPIVFFILYVIATIFMLPGTILTLGAGVVFGVVKGSILVSLSSTAGATAAFAVGRYIARDRVERRIEATATFRAMDQAVGQEGWKIVGLTRLSPVFPFNLLNYAFSLTRVSLRDYVLASWIGMIPGTVLYVYIGSLAGSLAELGWERAGPSRTPAEWILYAIGLIATAAITVIITRIARRALKQRMNPVPERERKQP
ncbi:MAG: TVP38/TMEM64 family protein [Acidobacteria bacterium]|nr:TVP38/TMEM64 family protein [Acidobacteriota bacterium]